MWAHALAVTGNNPAAEEGLSKALLQEGRVEEALPGLEKAVKFNAQDPVRHANLGSALYQLGRLQDAANEFATAAEVAPTAKVKSRSYESLASIYDELGDYAKVRESYEQALKADPKAAAEMVHRLSTDVKDYPTGARYLQLGLLLQLSGHVSEARAAYEQALKLDSSLQLAQQSLDSLPAATNPQ
jgi:tetratricopeptide (TPR) repeat protein